MKKRVLMSLVLLAIIVTSTVFAQEPTLDKLSFQKDGQRYFVNAKDRNVSGEVVIPATYQGLPVLSPSSTGSFFKNNPNITSITLSIDRVGMDAFSGMTGLKSVTLSANVTGMGTSAFEGCTNLTSVTFQQSNTRIDGNSAFPGDLVAKYKTGGAGTYTRTAGSDTWTKQGGFSLNGTWTRSDGTQITISGDGGQTFTITGNAPNNGGRFTRNFTER